jgi:predicted DNA-binding transcriptional regulator AlpA
MLSSRSSVASLPESGYVRQAKLLLFVPFSKSTLRRRVIDRNFPPPVKLSPGVTAWRVEDVRRWMAEVDIPLGAPSAAVVAVDGKAARQASPPSGRAGLAAGPLRLFRSARPA